MKTIVQSVGISLATAALCSTTPLAWSKQDLGLETPTYAAIGRMYAVGTQSGAATESKLTLAERAFISKTIKGNLKEVGFDEFKRFDEAYVADMVEVHKNDVAMFEKMAQQARDPELNKLVTDTLPTSQSHLKHIQSLAGSFK